MSVPSMSILFRHSFKPAMFSRFLKVAIATSNFTNEVYNGGFPPEFSISLSKEITVPVWDYVYGNKKQKKQNEHKI